MIIPGLFYGICFALIGGMLIGWAIDRWWKGGW
jgi:hypothetical protein